MYFMHVCINVEQMMNEEIEQIFHHIVSQTNFPLIKKTNSLLINPPKKREFEVLTLETSNKKKYLGILIMNYH